MHWACEIWDKKFREIFSLTKHLTHKKSQRVANSKCYLLSLLSKLENIFISLIVCETFDCIHNK